MDRQMDMASVICCPVSKSLRNLNDFPTFRHVYIENMGWIGWNTKKIAPRFLLNGFIEVYKKNISNYRIRPNYRTYPYKHTVKQYSLQITI